VHKKGVSHSHRPEECFRLRRQQSLRQSPGWGLSARSVSHAKGETGGCGFHFQKGAPEKSGTM